MKMLTADKIVTLQDFVFYIGAHQKMIMLGKAFLRVRDGKLYKRLKSDTDEKWLSKCGERIGLEAIIAAALKKTLEPITPLAIRSAIATLQIWEAEGAI